MTAQQNWTRRHVSEQMVENCGRAQDCMAIVIPFASKAEGLPLTVASRKCCGMASMLPLNHDHAESGIAHCLQSLFDVSQGSGKRFSALLATPPLAEPSSESETGACESIVLRDIMAFRNLDEDIVLTIRTSI